MKRLWSQIPAGEAFPERAVPASGAASGRVCFSTDPEGVLAAHAWPGWRLGSQLVCPPLLSLLILLVSSRCSRSLGHLVREHPGVAWGKSGRPSNSHSPHLGMCSWDSDLPCPGPVGTSPGQEHVGLVSAASPRPHPRAFAPAIPAAGIPSLCLSLSPFKSLSRGHFLSEATLTILPEIAAPTPDPSLGPVSPNHN